MYMLNSSLKYMKNKGRSTQKRLDDYHGTARKDVNFKFAKGSPFSQTIISCEIQPLRKYVLFNANPLFFHP